MNRTFSALAVAATLTSNAIAVANAAQPDAARIRLKVGDHVMTAHVIDTEFVCDNADCEGFGERVPG